MDWWDWVDWWDWWDWWDWVGLVGLVGLGGLVGLVGERGTKIRWKRKSARVGFELVTYLQALSVRHNQYTNIATNIHIHAHAHTHTQWFQLAETIGTTHNSNVNKVVARNCMNTTSGYRYFMA